MHPKSDNKEIINNDEADEVITKLFQTILKRYQKILQNR